MRRLLGDLNTTGGAYTSQHPDTKSESHDRLTDSLLDVSVNGELTCSDGSDHEQTSTNTAERTLQTKLLGDLDQTAGGSLTWKTLGLVDLGKHRVSRLRDDGSSETSNQTRSQVDDSLHSTRSLLLVKEVLVCCLGHLLVHHELGHSVWDLLEQHGSETRVETTDAFLLGDLAETTSESASECRLRYQSNTGGLERAEGDISEELGGGSGGEVDGGAVVGGRFVAEETNGLLLEEFISAEFECALEEVASKGWACTGKESTSSLVGDDLTETTDQSAVVGDWVELDTGLDAV